MFSAPGEWACTWNEDFEIHFTLNVTAVHDSIFSWPKITTFLFLLDEDLVSVKRPVWLVSKQVCLDPYIRCDISFLWEVLITRLLSTKYCKLPGTLTQLVFLSSLLCVINQFPSQKGNEWKKVGSRWVILLFLLSVAVRVGSQMLSFVY